MIISAPWIGTSGLGPIAPASLPVAGPVRECRACPYGSNLAGLNVPFFGEVSWPAIAGVGLIGAGLLVGMLGGGGRRGRRR